MNVRLHYDIEFMAGIYYEGCLQMNSYSVGLELLTQTPDALSTNIAMERLKAFVYGELANAVFVGPADAEKADMLNILGVNAVLLPDEPVDQIIGIMLYCKLNAVMEHRMVLTSTDTSSMLGDSVRYTHDEEDALGPFAQEGWWHRPSRFHNSVETEPAAEKVVKVESSGWHEYNLTWPEDRQEHTGNTVVFANFPKNEDQPTQ